MKQWSLDARSQAPLGWSHWLGREKMNVRSRRTTPQPFCEGKRKLDARSQPPLDWSCSRKADVRIGGSKC